MLRALDEVGERKRGRNVFLRRSAADRWQTSVRIAVRRPQLACHGRTFFACRCRTEILVKGNFASGMLTRSARICPKVRALQTGFRFRAGPSTGGRDSDFRGLRNDGSADCTAAASSRPGGRTSCPAAPTADRFRGGFARFEVERSPRGGEKEGGSNFAATSNQPDSPGNDGPRRMFRPSAATSPRQHAILRGGQLACGGVNSSSLSFASREIPFGSHARHRSTMPGTAVPRAKP